MSLFAFGLAIGEDEEFAFVQTSDGHVYTYPTEELAMEYFDCVKHHASLYRLDNDLSVARLVERGENLMSPAEAEPTEEQKLALWQSYVYKSLLSWAPYPDEV
ncbi:MAG: hypothetical protein ACYS7Y_20250 [Planctomycetota bacterium]|jgi:hypothetical protein